MRDSYLLRYLPGAITEGVPEPNLRQKEAEAVDVESSFKPLETF